MDEELQLLKKLEALNARHQDLDNQIDQLQASGLGDDFALHRLKRQKLALRDEIAKLQDALYPDIIA